MGQRGKGDEERVHVDTLDYLFQPPGSLNSSFDFLYLFQVMSQRQEDQEVQVRFIHPHLYLMYKYSWTF